MAGEDRQPVARSAADLVLANARLERELAELRAERQGAQVARLAAEGAQRVAETSRDRAIGAERRSQFLAEVGRVLGQSLDSTVTLEAVARLMVPTLADYCVVEMLDGGGRLRPLAVSHVAANAAGTVTALHARFADDPAAAYGAPGVLRSGRSELVVDVGETVATRMLDAEHLALVRDLGLVSSMILPLAARAEVVGALTLGATSTARGGSGRHFTSDDVLYAEDVGRRVAAAIDNARLHEALLGANGLLQEQAAELEIQQEQLQEQHAELEAQAAMLQEQAAELEIQGEELAQRNTALERMNDALERAAMVAEAATVVADAAQRAATSAQGEAEEANAAKSQFLANMSHELRTPLNAIAGYTELLDLELEGPVTAGQRNYLERLGRAQRHLLTLINDVLTFAKLEIGQSQLRIEAVPVDEVCALLEELVRPQLDAKGIRYVCAAARTPTGERLAVRADRDRMLQILVNLVGNALKFTASGGAVRVEAATSASPDMLGIRVTDTGSGIPADRQSAVFEPFVQLAAARERGTHGVGLGLAISRDLARAMGGDIALDSVVGVGSTFTLTLPRAGGA